MSPGTCPSQSLRKDYSECRPKVRLTVHRSCLAVGIPRQAIWMRLQNLRLILALEKQQQGQTRRARCYRQNQPYLYMFGSFAKVMSAFRHKCQKVDQRELHYLRF